MVRERLLPLTMRGKGEKIKEGKPLLAHTASVRITGGAPFLRTSWKRNRARNWIERGVIASCRQEKKTSSGTTREKENCFTAKDKTDGTRFDRKKNGSLSSSWRKEKKEKEEEMLLLFVFHQATLLWAPGREKAPGEKTHLLFLPGRKGKGGGGKEGDNLISLTAGRDLSLLYSYKLGKSALPPPERRGGGEGGEGKLCTDLARRGLNIYRYGKKKQLLFLRQGKGGVREGKIFSVYWSAHPRGGILPFLNPKRGKGRGGEAQEGLFSMSGGGGDVVVDTSEKKREKEREEGGIPCLLSGQKTSSIFQVNENEKRS